MTLSEINFSDKIAVTGRVRSWLEDSSKRLPVSCTTFTVKDSMEGEDGIEESWIFVSKALRGAAGVAVDLSNLRPSGTTSDHGLVASGPCSFAQIYSKLNEILRRGGSYKNGACTLYLDYNHPDIVDYLNLSPKEIPWAKRAVYVDENLMESPHLDLILAKMTSGEIWLNKKQWDKNGDRLYGNVCQEIYIKSRGTCLLLHVNLGNCIIEEIPQAFEEGMKLLCTIHPQTGVAEDGVFLSPQEDKQVGLGAIGLANLLAIEGVKYSEFVNALECKIKTLRGELASKALQYKAMQIADAIWEGFLKASEVATAHEMQRAFTIAPTATCSYNHYDRNDYTTTPEISPPISRTVVRESATFGNIEYQYPENVETAAEVGWDTQYRLMKAWQTLMDMTGLAHSISFNVWDSQPINKEWLEDWLSSSLKTTYYRLRVNQDSLDKSKVLAQADSEQEITSCGLNKEECSACAE